VPTASLFISGVQKELQEERRAVKAFVEGDPLLRRYFTGFLFEDLPAGDRRADQAYLDGVDCWFAGARKATRAFCYQAETHTLFARRDRSASRRRVGWAP